MPNFIVFLEHEEQRVPPNFLLGLFFVKDNLLILTGLALGTPASLVPHFAHDGCPGFLPSKTFFLVPPGVFLTNLLHDLDL